jgi:chromosome segregation ATPase
LPLRDAARRSARSRRPDRHRAERGSQSSAGWLTRRIELAELQGKLLELDQHIVSLNAEMAKLDTESEQTQQQQDEIKANCTMRDMTRSKRNTLSSACPTISPRIDRELHALDSERSELDQRLESLNASERD